MTERTPANSQRLIGAIIAGRRLCQADRLEQLRKQAKEVRDLARAGAPGALELIGAHHPAGPRAVSLAGAQPVVARHYGFASWRS